MFPFNQRASSRFARGGARGWDRRGGNRGGGAHRPYFYFRRNGRIIPGHSRARGGIMQPPAGFGSSRIAGDFSSSFLRPQIYAAPEDAEQMIQSFAVEIPNEYPGWRLYFYSANFEENNSIHARLQLMQAHYKNFVMKYDFLDIQKKGYFQVMAKILHMDEDLRRDWPTLRDDMQSNPYKTMTIMALAMQTLALDAAIDAHTSKEKSDQWKIVRPRIVKPRKIYVRPEGFLVEQPMEQISLMEVDQLYCVRGLVQTMGDVEVYASWMAYKCSRCKQDQALRQGDLPIRPNGCKTHGCMAKQGFVEMRSSPFSRLKVKQTIELAEARLDVLQYDNNSSNYCLEAELHYDLVDSVVIGEEVIMTGVLKMRGLQESTGGKEMKVYLKVCSIIKAERIPHHFNEHDIQAITTINGAADSFKLLVHSLAPEIYGHEMVKAGALLSTIGGAGSQLHDEEEINILLIGDPGVGKSGIAKVCAQISQKGALIQSKQELAGSGPKLTATVKGRAHIILESGGLLRANKGHCSIDDIDRFSSQQDSLINLMQTQSLVVPTVATYINLSASTSVIATANSMRGHYDQSKLLANNIRISPILLNEFHLVFLMLDKPDKGSDAIFSEHVRAVHAGSKKNSTIMNKFNTLPKFNNTMSESDWTEQNGNPIDLMERLKFFDGEEDLDLIPTILLKKFITYARQQVKPLLIAEAAEILKKFYMELREQQHSDEDSLCINSGHLAGLIRLCQARARIDFSTEVTTAHVHNIISLIKHSNADIKLGDYIDNNPSRNLQAMATTSQLGRNSGGAAPRGNAKKFLQMLQMRSNALCRRIFEYDELKDMATRLGITCGVSNLIDTINYQGLLLKKGPNMYELLEE
uniref:MCM C-terminal AAA(+) ATPase domain-containing protein n=1 Tax=Glossina brevipalpis TaxID=37001 RepID=A0A1A9WRM4_9MUSC